MTPAVLFQTQLVLGYVAWLACYREFIGPWLASMPRMQAHRVIAALHSFRFFGLAFIMPGVVGSGLPAGFAQFAAYGDFATGILAICALLTTRVTPVFGLFVVAFNLVGVTDLLANYYHAVRHGLPEAAGQLAATYAVPVIYVPLLMITHVVSLRWLLAAGLKGTERSLSSLR